MLRVRKVGEETRALLRMIDANGGLAYHDMLLIIRGRQVRIADVYAYGLGEFVSASMRHMALPLIAQERKSTAHKVPSSQSEYVKNIDKVLAMVRAVAAHKPERALTIYEQLPDSVKKHRYVMMCRCRAAALKGPNRPEYDRALADIKALFPNDPGLDLVLMDYYLEREQFTKVHGCIDRLEKAIGGDAYLDVLRAHIWLRQKRHAKARAACERAIATEPTLEPAYWALAEVFLDQKDWPAVSKVLTRLETALGGRIEGLDQIDVLAEYIRSEEYKNWQASREKRQTDE